MEVGVKTMAEAITIVSLGREETQRLGIPLTNFGDIIGSIHGACSHVHQEELRPQGASLSGRGILENSLEGALEPFEELSEKCPLLSSRKCTLKAILAFSGNR